MTKSYRYNFKCDAFSALYGRVLYSRNQQQYHKHSGASLEGLQFLKLSAMIKHAFDTTDYYRDIISSTSIVDGVIHDIEQLQEIPILSRDFVRKNFKSLISNKNFKFVENATTSGSSGVATPLRQTWRQIAFDTSSIWWSFSFAGYKFRDSMATLRSYVPTKNESLWKEDALRGFYFMSAYHLDDTSLSFYLDKLRQRKPKFIRGYPHSLAVLAQYCIDKGVDDIQFHHALTCSENLSDIQRKQIEKAFNTKVLDRYGNIEMVAHATQCTYCHDYHVDPLYGVVQIVDNAGNPVAAYQEGRVIATGLENYAMPLIRYEIGDVAVKGNGRCKCNLETPTLSSISGRMDDVLYKQDGSAIPPVNFYTMFQKFPEFAGFRLYQDKNFKINIQVKAQNIDASQRVMLDKLMRDRVGQDAQINIELVNDFELTKFGKFRNIKSDVCAK